MYLSRFNLTRYPLATLLQSVALLMGMAAVLLTHAQGGLGWLRVLGLALLLACGLGGLMLLWMRVTARRLACLFDTVANDSPEALARRPAEVLQAVSSVAWWQASAVQWLGLGALATGAVYAALGHLVPVSTGKAPSVPELLLALAASLMLVRELLGPRWLQSALVPLCQFELAWRGWRQGARALQPDVDGTRSLAMLNWLSEVRRGVKPLYQAWRAPANSPLLSDVGRELSRLRLVVFATAMSEELMRPFFAVFAAGVSAQVALPVGVFMLTLALAQPLGPWLTRRVDTSRAMAGVALLGAGGMLLTAVSTSALLLTVLRAFSGLVYGLMLILAQTTIVRITESRQRARGLTQVSAAIVAAGVCGPALGGLVAERWGSGVALGACAACLAVAAVLSLRLAPLRSHNRAGLAGLGGWHGLAAVMAQPQVMGVTWWAAVPARLAAAALLVVITPLYLEGQGVHASVTGQVLLLYFLCFVVVAPLAAYASDLQGQRRPWIVAGCALSAAACAALPLLGGVGGAALCCALLGVAQALLSAPQLALVTEAFERRPEAVQAAGATPEQALATFRFIERVGSVAAPFLVMWAAERAGLTGAVNLIALLLALGTIGVMYSLRSPSP
jgi:MFS family permease